MRSAGPIASLLGSLGLHACAVLLFVIAARQPVDRAPQGTERGDAWQGSNALEVDAVATPETEPNVANVASAEEQPAPETPSENVPAPEAPPEPPSPEAIEPPRPKPKPRPRRPKPAAAAATAESTGRHSATTPGATGAFGSADLPPGVRSLPSAFTRAIPPATGADPVWQRLPVGVLPTFVLALQVDVEGHIGSTQLVGKQDGIVPEYVDHFRERVIALLGGGLFALQNNGNAGTDLFRVTITLSDRAVKEESEPAELVERGFEPPRGSTPGRAYFTLASGRHFEAKVEVLGAPLRK